MQHIFNFNSLEIKKYVVQTTLHLKTALGLVMPSQTKITITIYW